MFDKLEYWSKSSESAVKYFSSTAVYRKAFNMLQAVSKQQFFLDLGVVKNTTKVRVNGKDLGVIWCSPWQVEITSAVEPGENILEIEVVNLWGN